MSSMLWIQKFSNRSVHRIGNEYLSLNLCVREKENSRNAKTRQLPKSYNFELHVVAYNVTLSTAHQIQSRVTTKTMLKQHFECITTC